MTLLAIESATDSVGVGLIRHDGGSAERVHAGGRAHAELLAPAIEEVCAVSGTELAAIERIAVDIGPGLFTGLRVGVATAKALAWSLSVPLLGVSSLDILAAAAAETAPGPGPAGAVAAVVDARRGEVFAAAYRFDRAGPDPQDPDRDAHPIDPGAVRLDQPGAISPEALVAWLSVLAAETGRVQVVGDGAVRYLGLLSGHDGLDLDLAGRLVAPPPLALARLALARLSRGAATTAPAALVPDYRRQADARINWEQRLPRPHEPQGGAGRQGAGRL
ncbi:MAG TPA: tRNA (adenosine(37)-N6)-threonylcarbamoyltransferase complex dimerization subunit type 1 TsaB [Acidimicrobiales bacterium]|nr:tRNA (adenosine(37)-N6)-threonylcarbamoyltransferase complex dimerization subunit type 1 TsaB [Acidimicrobiales bacterium]